MKFNVSIAYPSPLIAAGSLFFNGTAVWLRGAGIPTKLPYTVNLDSVEFTFATGQLLPDALFYDTTLGDIEHNVLIQPASLLDTVVLEMDLGDQADAIMSLDDSMLFQEDGFTTKGQWTINECLGSGRAAGTCHVSEGTGSEFSYEFEGDAITVWGAVEDVNSFYTVSIDGLQPTSYSPPNTTSSRPITVLAHASNLGAGSHTLTLTSQPKDGKSRVEIDSVQLYAKTTSGSSTVPSGSTSGTSIAGASAAADSSGGLSKTAKIAIIAGIICAVILLGALVTFILLMRKRNARAAAHSRTPSTHASGIRVDVKTRTRDDDEETLAGSVKDLKKDGMELGPIESQTRLPPRW